MNIQILWDDQADAPAVTPSKAAANAAMLKDALKAKNPYLALAKAEGHRPAVPRTEKGQADLAELSVAVLRVLNTATDAMSSRQVAKVIGKTPDYVSNRMYTLRTKRMIRTSQKEIYQGLQMHQITPKGRAYLAEQEGAA